MADVSNASHIQILHGKTSKHDRGYFYETPFGKQKYRTRKEGYQKNQSPKQKWNSLAFAWAHAQLRALLAEPEQVKQIKLDYRAAMRRTPNGKVYADAQGWKFAMLQLQWKSEHLYEQWYADYLQTVQQRAAEKTASEQTSDYMLRTQIANLSAQLDSLKAQLAARTKHE